MRIQSPRLHSSNATNMRCNVTNLAFLALGDFQSPVLCPLLGYSISFSWPLLWVEAWVCGISPYFGQSVATELVMPTWLLVWFDDACVDWLMMNNSVWSFVTGGTTDRSLVFQKMFRVWQYIQMIETYCISPPFVTCASCSWSGSTSALFNNTITTRSFHSPIFYIP